MLSKSILDNYLRKVNNEIFSEISPIGAIQLGLTAFQFGQIAYDAFKKALDVAERKCSELEDRERSICLIKVRITEQQKLIDRLQKAKILCKNSRDPMKCKTKLDKKIKKAKERLQDFKFQYRIILSKRGR